MKTAELDLWFSFWKPLSGACRLRWLRLAVAGLHFQVDAVSFVHDHIFDSTGLLLRKAIRRYTHDGQRVLDLGTGHLGLLAIYCARTHNLKVIAVDVSDEFLENAILVAEASHASGIEFRKSDWFSNLEGTFDVIFSNAPYVPTHIGALSHYSKDHPQIWDGGKDGLDCERKIINEAGHFLSSEGLLLLGRDTTYVPRNATLNLVQKVHDLELKDIVKSWISKSEVYVIGHRGHN
ncbi:MAG: methyltransferase [Desulfomonilaceae bacterium]